MNSSLKQTSGWQNNGCLEVTVTYSINWMGPVRMDWFRERGLTKTVREILEEDQTFGKLKKGEIFEYEEVTESYSAGRIDIRDDTKYGYDGWDEYSLAPMRTEDWNALSDWLDSVDTNTQWSYNDLIANFERFYGKPIRWADDIWYKCYECGLVTDLREYPKTHKMGCTRKWDNP